MAPVSSVVTGAASDRRRLPSRFAYSLKSAAGSTWVDATGEVDIASSQQLKRALDAALERTRIAVLDLRGLTFLDSTGVHVIVNAAERARREGGKLVVVRGPSQVDRVLTLTGACKTVLIVDDAPPEPAAACVGPQEIRLSA